MERTSVQTLALHLKPIWVKAIRGGDKHLFMCRIQSHGHSCIWLITPLEIHSWWGSTGNWLLLLLLLLVWEHHRMLWWSGSFAAIFWRSSGGFCEIHCCYVMDASPPLVFASWKLPDEVLLRVTCNLSWCSSDHKIAWNVSPITFAILLQPQ